MGARSTTFQSRELFYGHKLLEVQHLLQLKLDSLLLVLELLNKYTFIDFLRQEDVFPSLFLFST